MIFSAIRFAAAALTAITAPVGSDVLIEVDLHAAAAMGSSWPTVAGLVEGPPSLAGWSETLQDWMQRVEANAGCDLHTPSCRATVAIDVDADMPVFSAVLQGCGNAPARVREGAKAFNVDGLEALKSTDGRLAWLWRQDGTLMLGDPRGLMRLLRVSTSSTSSSKAPKEAPLVREWSQMRRQAVLRAAFVAPDAGKTAPFPWGWLATWVRQGHITIDANKVAARLSTSPDVTRDVLLNNIEGGALLVRAMPPAIAAAARLLQSGSWVQTFPWLPPDAAQKIDVDLREALAAFSMRTSIRPRGEDAVEITIDVSTPAGLLLGSAFLATMFHPDSSSAAAARLLRAVRTAERVFMARTGTYLPCGPVPGALPTKPLPWPSHTCLDILGVEQAPHLEFQVEARVAEDGLVLVARGDTNADGVPEVWTLYEGSEGVQQLTSTAPHR